MPKFNEIDICLRCGTTFKPFNVGDTESIAKLECVINETVRSFDSGEFDCPARMIFTNAVTCVDEADKLYYFCPKCVQEILSDVFSYYLSKMIESYYKNLTKNKIN